MGCRPLFLDETASGDRRVLCVVPAHNEAANLTAVVTELRARHPGVDVLVMDDGSTDGTRETVARLGVKWLRFHERMGVGCVMRAALRFAERLDYDIVVRVDGDGQHRADDLDWLMGPLVLETADVVLGSRFVTDEGATGGAGVVQALLARCLSSATGHLVTDPTSGFCAMGRRAIGILADHHPTGYAEPELRLFMKRNGLRALEVPVRARPRLSGRTSLTAARLVTAAARAALALVVVLWRTPVKDASD